MNEQDLDIRFQEAVKTASEMTQASLPQDVQLRLYAYYKHATFGALESQQTSTYHLRDAFKMNALMQISSLCASEAKEHYIEIMNSLIEK
jgi:acyl-CoA-binding protein